MVYKPNVNQASEGILYLVGVGFTQPRNIPTKNPPSVAMAYSYAEFDPERVRNTLGKPKWHSADGVFVFRLSSDRALRVSTAKKTILLVSGRTNVRKLMEASRNA